MADFIIGVDLGQARDFTAITVLEVLKKDTGKRRARRDLIRSMSFDMAGNSVGGEIRVPQEVIYEHSYAARHLERLTIGTPYPRQVERVRELHDELLRLPAVEDGLRARASSAVSLVVDQTGVGRPVVDMLRAAELRPVAITITGGDSVTRDGRDYRVPKRDLVSVVQVLLQSRRLKIAKDLLEAQTLISELLAFKVSISLRGHDSYGNDVGMWRENPHDDMVLATAVAAWYGENRPKPFPPIPQARVIATAR